MAVESTRADLLAIEQAHQNVHDGGYQLAATLCDYRAQMPEETVNEWDEVIMDWVRNESARFWGVALEALVRGGGPGVNGELADLLREPGRRSGEWREHVVNTLIRRGFCDTELKAEVEGAARRRSPMGLPNLAASLVQVPELLASAAACIVAAMSMREYEYVEANVPPFVYAAADSDSELLVRLVQQISAEDRESGRRFGQMVIEYLGKAFVQDCFPGGVALEISNEIRGVLSS